MYLWFSFLLPISLLFSQGTEALTLHRRANPSVVALDIQRKDVIDPVSRDRTRRKRDKTISQKLDNEVCQSVVLFSPFSIYFWIALPTRKCRIHSLTDLIGDPVF